MAGAHDQDRPHFESAIAVDLLAGLDAICKAVELQGAWTGAPLRPYQQSALMAWELAGRRGTVVLPTGSGKTRVALAAIAACKRSAICLVPTRVLLVSAFTDSGIVYQALESGASGFVSKESRREQIVDAVLACARGENVVPGDIAAGLVSEIRLRKNDDRPALTQREHEILKLIAAGKSLPEIAKELYLGLTTVKTHVQHLYEKLGVSDRAAAVASAMRRGLIE